MDLLTPKPAGVVPGMGQDAPKVRPTAPSPAPAPAAQALPAAERVPAHILREAVSRLISAHGPHDAAVDAFLSQAKAEGSDLSLLWATPSPEGYPGEVCLLVRAPGRTAVLFVSPPGTRETQQSKLARAGALAAAMDFARRELDVVLVQSIVEPEAVDTIATYELAGLSRLANLAYMRRDLRTLLKAAQLQSTHLPAGVTVRTFGDQPPREADKLLKIALEGSYIGTLDCPALCGMRSLDDVLESHKAVGRFDPRLWWIVEKDGHPEGCLLLSPVAENGTVELVYLGVSPVLRGSGVAGAIFAHGLRTLQGRTADTVACAVDLSNTPALKFYERWKFKRFATRVALVCPLAPAGRGSV